MLRLLLPLSVTLLLILLVLNTVAHYPCTASITSDTVCMSAHLLVHEVEVLSLRCQSSDSLFSTALPVQAVVIIKADDGGHVADEGVGVGVAAWRERW